MQQNSSKRTITIECSDNKHFCDISRDNLGFLINSRLLYCCTLSRGMPHITPIMYYYEMNECSLSFLIGKTSVKARNLRKNPFVSLTTDTTHPSNPLENSGIMITAVTELSDSWEDISECLERLRRRYSSHLIPMLVETFASTNDLYVKAEIIRIVHWKGPFFERFECPTRKLRFKI
ncbi:MAG: pyridoxamine 5'-phosphate oxidase family protein [Candidatus Heimdallarchaeota archaeon]